MLDIIVFIARFNKLINSPKIINLTNIGIPAMVSIVYNC